MPGTPRIGLFPGPAWYSASWLRRWPIAVDAVTGTDSGSVDVSVVIPSTWDWFWDGVQDTTNGYDIIVCGQDGTTLLDFQYSGLNFSTRTLTIQIDALALNGTGTMNMIWLYWYNVSFSNLTNPFTPSSPITGYITLVGPGGGWTATAVPANTEATAPAVTWSKKSTETLTGWVDLSLLLSLQTETYNGKYNYEGVESVVVSTDGLNPLDDDTLTRYTYYDGKLWVLGNWSGGTDDTDYDGIYTITTTEGRIIDYRVTISVDDLD